MSMLSFIVRQHISTIGTDPRIPVARLLDLDAPRWQRDQHRCFAARVLQNSIPLSLQALNQPIELAIAL